MEAGRDGDDRGKALEGVVLNVAGPCVADFCSLWEAGELCDVALRAGDDAGAAAPLLPAHQLVLAAASSYFRGAFVGAGRHMTPLAGAGGAAGPATEPQQLPVVELPGLEPQQLLAVVRAVYTQRLAVSADNVQSLLACSDFLGVAAVTDACCAFLERHLDVHTCLATLRLASHFNCMGLLKHTESVAFSCCIRASYCCCWVLW